MVYAVIWRPVPGFDGYEAGTDGTVSSSKGGKRKRLTPYPKSSDGRPCYQLSQGGRPHTFAAGRLVCMAFHGAPVPGQQARHLDGDPWNNVPENVAWGTVAENHADRWSQGTAGERIGKLRRRRFRAEWFGPWRESGRWREVPSAFGYRVDRDGQVERLLISGEWKALVPRVNMRTDAGPRVRAAADVVEEAWGCPQVDSEPVQGRG